LFLIVIILFCSFPRFSGAGIAENFIVARLQGLPHNGQGLAVSRYSVLRQPGTDAEPACRQAGKDMKMKIYFIPRLYSPDCISLT
jgi:hypothetical protein